MRVLDGIKEVVLALCKRDAFVVRRREKKVAFYNNKVDMLKK